MIIHVCKCINRLQFDSNHNIADPTFLVITIYHSFHSWFLNGRILSCVTSVQGHVKLYAGLILLIADKCSDKVANASAKELTIMYLHRSSIVPFGICTYFGIGRVLTRCNLSVWFYHGCRYIARRLLPYSTSMIQLFSVTISHNVESDQSSIRIVIMTIHDRRCCRVVSDGGHASTQVRSGLLFSRSFTGLESFG